ncbi:MAG: NADH-quinone oxidoreductase subunit K [Candidatus Heimdallarchaeota archaeon]|nr:NADH-quinone oxidoreductase subunit K [Candidatus Heimdallarchaeota archaeon]
MLDWTTAFPYIVISVILLFSIGIYTLISSKKFLKIVFGLQFMLIASNVLLLSFGCANNEKLFLSDSLAQTLSLFIMIIGLSFGIIGIAIDKRLRVTEGSTDVEFDFMFGSNIEASDVQTNSKKENISDKENIG